MACLVHASQPQQVKHVSYPSRSYDTSLCTITTNEKPSLCSCKCRKARIPSHIVGVCILQINRSSFQICLALIPGGILEQTTKQSYTLPTSLCCPRAKAPCPAISTVLHNCYAASESPSPVFQTIVQSYTPSFLLALLMNYCSTSHVLYIIKVKVIVKSRNPGKQQHHQDQQRWATPSQHL